ncbi:hypothetical protein NQ318_011799 [Aromia moschata]|uniref:Uncharacterized protein n=1 Tax=Aromia moschata TaxID=1265417 RepID=A0AAV8Y4P0_9CUCU|nr:hypothetical protein NQ318_011799 [Aromia moschata]
MIGQFHVFGVGEPIEDLLFVVYVAVIVDRLPLPEINTTKVTRHLKSHASTSADDSVFFYELTEAFVARNIPLNKLETPKLNMTARARLWSYGVTGFWGYGDIRGYRYRGYGVMRLRGYRPKNGTETRSRGGGFGTTIKRALTSNESQNLSENLTADNDIQLFLSVSFTYHHHIYLPVPKNPFFPFPFSPLDGFLSLPSFASLPGSLTGWLAFDTVFIGVGFSSFFGGLGAGFGAGLGAPATRLVPILGACSLATLLPPAGGLGQHW